jgi:hypothetical protein
MSEQPRNMHFAPLWIRFSISILPKQHSRQRALFEWDNRNQCYKKPDSPLQILQLKRKPCAT